MKMDTKGKIRLTELGIGIIAGSIVQLCDRDNIIATNLCTLPYMASVITSFRTEKKTEDYKELEKLYNEVIKNTADLMKKLGTTEPISSFATFMYMYRNGYLSLNKKYNYSTKMKDFGNIQGIDVIRGLGVCRSIASFYSDVCDELGMNASVITVNAKDAIPQIEKLCPKDKPIPDNKTKLFVKFIKIFTKAVPTSNHAITTVEQGGINYILDAMNDGFLKKGEKNELYVANNEDYYMKLNLPITELNRIVLNTKIKKLKALKNQISKQSIKYDEYKTKYLETLEVVENNKEEIENFYINNKHLYEEISEKSEKHGGILSRSTGFDQIIKYAKSERFEPVREAIKQLKKK